MIIVEKSIDELRPYERNAKIHSPKQVQQIANSLLEFGWQQPLVIDRDGVVVVGHGRLEGSKIARAKDPSFNRAPCVIADTLTEEQVKAYRLADNKLNESPWDVDLQSEELAAFSEIDMSAFGFDLSELVSNEEQEVVEDDYDEAPPAMPKAKLGDIYQLGKHRLMCGDSTLAENVKELTGGSSRTCFSQTHPTMWTTQARQKTS